MSLSQATLSIAPEDTIMARVTFRGCTVANFISTGFASLAEVIRAVRAAAGTVAGSVQLTLRNASRGWTRNSALFLMPVAPGVQLSLF